MKFKSYICVFIGKINEIHISINEISNREVPEFPGIIFHELKCVFH